MNHPVFSPANNTASSSPFGTITERLNRPHLMQVVARLVF